MSSRVRRWSALALLWIPVLAVSGLLLMIARYEHAAAAVDLAVHQQMDEVLKRDIAYAAADVEREQSALDSALNSKGPKHEGNADKHFDAVFGTLDALDTAWALYEGSGASMDVAQRAADYPVRTVLGGAAMMLVVLGVAATEGRGMREEGRGGHGGALTI